MRIYTLGTSTRTLEEFLDLLRDHGIRTAVDVRRFPTSRFSHFTREALEASLRREGIGYLWLGDLLGGYRKGGYEAYMATEDFERGLSRLKAIAQEGTTAFFCSERFPWRCHRRFIALRLREEGWEVVDLY